MINMPSIIYCQFLKSEKNKKVVKFTMVNYMNSFINTLNNK